MICIGLLKIHLWLKKVIEGNNQIFNNNKKNENRKSIEKELNKSNEEINNNKEEIEKENKKLK